jgi:hypothetical protein
LVAIRRVGVGPGVKMDSQRLTMKFDMFGMDAGAWMFEVESWTVMSRWCDLSVFRVVDRSKWM